jgi:4-hydroxybenzoate polyprenyltransferase
VNSKLKAWAQLVRVPNTLTACADVLAGFTLVAGSWFHILGSSWSVVTACIASICFYWSGMVLNDVHDVAIDREQRRNGPLVRGDISIHAASWFGWVLLLLGPLLAVTSLYLLPDRIESPPQWSVLVIACTLAALVVAYNSRLKGTRIGPVLMGLCRGLNLLLGVSLGVSAAWPVSIEWTGVGMATLGHVLFITGITLAARREGRLQQSANRLAASWSVSLMGIGLIAFCSVASSRESIQLHPLTWFPGLIGMLAFPWIRRAMASIHLPGSQTLVTAIKQAILSIIFFDAAIAFQFGGQLPGLIVCSLAIPTFAMGRYFRMT